MSYLKDKPAFPRPTTTTDTSAGRINEPGELGMTYREYLAAQIMASLVNKESKSPVPLEDIAELALVYTDLLIANLEK